jgi:hypothetical protein
MIQPNRVQLINYMGYTYDEATEYLANLAEERYDNRKDDELVQQYAEKYWIQPDREWCREG